MIEKKVYEDKIASVQGPVVISACAMLIFLVREELMTAIGLGWSLFLFLLFLNRLGKSFPVLELMLVMAALQWIVGAWMAYQDETDHWRYYMYVDESTYMNLAVPGLILLSIGIFLFFPRYSFNEVNEKLQIYVSSNSKIPYFLIVIGLTSTYLGPLIPSSLRFIFYLLSTFQYAGLALLIFMPHKKSKWIWFIGVMTLLTISSIVKGMFHDLFLWSALLASFVVIQLNLGTNAKLLMIVVGFLALIVVQTIKGQYREVARGLQTGDRLELFTNLFSSQVEDFGLLGEESSVETLNVRFNQGWIISSIIYNVPNYEPFAEGETVIEAIKASILPRFLNPSKKKAGGQENFRRFTGIGIRDGTSMGTSILGEAYGNYGLQGSWIFMLVWGIFLALVFRVLINYGKKKPIVLAFIPLIFLQVIKAETEIYVVLNHFVKSILLVVVFLWIGKNILR